MSKCFWPHHEPRIHAMITDIQLPCDPDRMAEMHLAINHRREVEGEIVLLVPIGEARSYRVGDVYAAHFVLNEHPEKEPSNHGCFWPRHEPRIHAKIDSISPAFNAGQTRELRLLIQNRKEVGGEISLRIPTEEADNYHVGSTYSAHFKLVSEFKRDAK